MWSVRRQLQAVGQGNGRLVWERHRSLLLIPVIILQSFSPAVSNNEPSYRLNVTCCPHEGFSFFSVGQTGLNFNSLFWKKSILF